MRRGGIHREEGDQSARECRTEAKVFIPGELKGLGVRRPIEAIDMGD